LLDGGKQGTGQGLHRQGVGTGHLDEFTELDGLFVNQLGNGADLQSFGI